jgi:hypothetical protein
MSGDVPADHAADRRPQVVIAATILATAGMLWLMGRRWWCVCGQSFLWTSEAYSAHTSQHLLDPYTFTHVLHGFLAWWVICGLGGWIARRWQVAAAIVAESVWEIVENTPMVIDRYRQATAALGYEGDTIINAVGDIGSCWLGVLLARRIGGIRSLLVFAATEVWLLLWIRDSLLLNILMLVWPTDALQHWQLGS